MNLKHEKIANNANTLGRLKASRKNRATLLIAGDLRRYK
jgi:hypothetical protein